MESTLLHKLRGGWKLLRFIAVISSSFVAILSSLLPLLLYTSLSTGTFIFMFIFLGFGATIVHGVLVHLFNDYADNLTGTDAYSPGILSGGSRVIQEGFMQPFYVLKLGKWVAAVLLVMAAVVSILGYIEITLLILIGVWAAISYSLPPISLSYRPFLGEWLSLFPAVFFLGIAGPWLLVEAIPIWAYQNAVINALVCMGWVMVHHIPDVKADMRARPKKQTSVVWFAERFGIEFARIPALLYFFIAGFCTIWVGVDRLAAGIITAIFLVTGLFFIMRVNPKNVEQVTKCEQILLLLAILIGLTLGIF